MLTIFDILKDIIQDKKGNLNESSEFFEAINSTYMIQRWCSMESVKSSYIINETLNKLYKGISDDKVMLYKLLVKLIDKDKYKKIRYIKRSNIVVNEEVDVIIGQIAKNMEISKSEVEEYIKIFNIDLEKYNKN